MASRDKERLDEEEEVTEVPRKKGKGVLKWVLIGLGAVVLVGASVGASIYVVTTMLHSEIASQDAPKDGAKKAKDGKKESKEPKDAIYYKMDPPFVVNFQGPAGNRFLQVTIELMTYEQDVIPAIEQHMPVLRNNIVFLLSSVNLDEISTLEGKQKLRQDTLQEVRKVLKDKIGKPGVEEVYFTSIVMQ